MSHPASGSTPPAPPLAPWDDAAASDQAAVAAVPVSHPRVIAVLQVKGGVGKTSISTNLACSFARAGQRVLFVDLDPQGGAAIDLGYLAQTDEGAAMVGAAIAGVPARLITGVRRFDNGGQLDALPGGNRLRDLTAALDSRAREGDFSNAAVINTINGLAYGSAPDGSDGYDLVMIDCPPGERTLQEAALSAARHILVPTRTDAGSRKALRDTAERFGAARQRNPDLNLLGVVLFGVNPAAALKEGAAHTRDEAEVRSIPLRKARRQLSADLGGQPELIFQTTIRYAEAPHVQARDLGLVAFELEEAAQTRRDIPASARALAGDYYSLANEFSRRIAAYEQEEGTFQ